MRSRHARRIGIGVVGLAVVVGTFAFVLPRIADYRDVWDVVKELSWAQIGILAAVTALNLATYAPPWQAALPGLSYRNAFVLSTSSTASTYLAPGGPAVGVALSYGMLRSWGFRRQDVTLAVALTGTWNQFVMLGLPSVALALLTIEGEHHTLLKTVALIGLGVFVIAAASYAAGLSSRRLARWSGNLTARIASWIKRLFGRGPVSWTGETFAGFRAQAVALLRRRWPFLTVATLAGQLTVFVVLLACLRVFDVPPGQVTVIEAFAAWSLVRLLGSIPLTPGGLGIVELGLTTALVGFGGGNAQVVTSVLVYRFLTIVPTLLLGLLSAATWKRHRPPQLVEEGTP
ncbi:MAG TPA: lysylphosphatidylglycerol synthase transmembrane domain-containing protein [Gaiellaceae bacterium]|nr:lysylphosphatidylglycerol synthase transmembrane domain-containing protein [Gaiellaceae bacterium]